MKIKILKDLIDTNLKTTITDANSTNLNQSSFASRDFYCLAFIIGLIGIDFLPNFASIDFLAPQYCYLAILNLIALVFFATNSAHYLQINWKSIFYNKAVIAYSLFILFCGLSIFAADNQTLWLVHFTKIIICLLTILNLILFCFDNQKIFKYILMIVLISMFVNFSIELVKFFKNDSVFNALSQLSGNSGNINIYSASVNLKIVFALTGLYYFKGIKRLLVAIILTQGVLIIFLNSSKGMLLALFAQLFLFCIFQFKLNIQKQKSLQTTIVVALSVLFSYLCSSFIFSKLDVKNERYTNVITRVSAAAISTTDKESATGRFFDWGNAVLIIKKNPVFGVGLGNWQLESLPYETKFLDGLTISIHTHNDFLEIASETGVLNGLIYLSLFAMLFLLNLNIFFRSKNYESRVISLFVLLSVIVYSIDAFLNFPLYRCTIQVHFALFFALSVVNSGSILSTNSVKSTTENLNIKRFFIIAIVLFTSLLTVYSSFKSFIYSQLEYTIRTDFNSENPQLNSNLIAKEVPNLPNLLSTTEPFVQYLAIYFGKEKNYTAANKYFTLAEKMNPYTGRPNYYRHKMLLEQGKIDSAYFYIKKSFNVRPRVDYYFSEAQNLAAKLKDTAEIVRMHNLFTSFIQTPTSWLNTTSNLVNSQYPTENIIEILKKGLLIFPEDAVLKQRLTDLNKDKPVLEFRRLHNLESNGSRKTESTALANVAENTTKITKNSPIASRSSIIAITNNYFKQANVLFEKGAYEKAIPLFDEVLKINPSEKSAIQNIGICYYHLKQYQKALSYLQKTTNFADGKSEFVIGMCYYSLKKTDESCTFLNIALSKNYADAQKAINLICK